jgi:hypothetical protein
LNIPNFSASILYRNNNKFSLETFPSEAHNIFVMKTSSCEIWFRDYIIHREDGPAIIHKNGSLAYCENGVFHREDGPAIINSHGQVQYWNRGKISNESGPAVIYMNGDVEYWINGTKIDSELQFSQLIANRIYN